MGAERFANLAETTVDSAYTATDTTLEVADASAFPSAGPFRVRIGNADKTLWRVDSVSGNVFTGAAEEFDGNASVGDTVVCVWTKGSAERLIQSPDSGDMVMPSGPLGADRYSAFGGFKVVPLDQSGWSWFNQGSAAVAQGGGVVRLFDASNTGGTNIRGRLRGSYPSPPFVLVAVVKPWFENAEYTGAFQALDSIGIAVSDGTKYKDFIASNFTWGTGHAPSVIGVEKMNTVSSAGAEVAHSLILPPLIWLKLEDDNTNQIFSYSFDGINYVTLLSEARTTFLTPSDIGIVMNHQTGATPAGGDVISWDLQ